MQNGEIDVAILPETVAPAAPRCESVMLEFDTADPAAEIVSDPRTQAAEPGWN